MQESATSTFVSASDGLRLHARCYGRASLPALPAICLPGLARTAADFEKLAIVGGPDWIPLGIKAFRFLMKGEIRTYPSEQLEAAWEWVAG